MFYVQQEQTMTESPASQRNLTVIQVNTTLNIKNFAETKRTTEPNQKKLKNQGIKVTDFNKTIP